MPAAIPSSHRDLLEAPVVGTLTTVGADGYPQSTAIWFLLDGDVVRTSLLPERQKYKNLVRHPQGTLFLVDPTNQYRTLEVRADATVDDDPELAFLDRLLAHYGTDRASFPAPTDGRIVMTLTPHHVVTNG